MFLFLWILFRGASVASSWDQIRLKKILNQDGPETSLQGLPLTNKKSNFIRVIRNED